MKCFLNPCRRHRESLCLLASGLLPEPNRAGIENHLAQCAGCRSYYDEIKAVTAPLATWEKNFAHIEPGAAVRLRLANAAALTGRSEVDHPPAPKIVLLECWRQLILPSRRIWAGLAAIWILIFLFGFSQRDRAELMPGKRPPSPEAIQAWQQQQRLLVELIGPSETHATRPLKAPLPQPRSEQNSETMAV